MLFRFASARAFLAQFFQRRRFGEESGMVSLVLRDLRIPDAAAP